MLKPIVGKKVYEELMTFAPVRGRPRKLPEERKERPPATELQKKYRDLAMTPEISTAYSLFGQGRKKKSRMFLRSKKIQ
jgi:hypothetical protein